jgi:catechol 2,3-dioxygenase-like lactoylglutathione lyase family enzyme
VPVSKWPSLGQTLPIRVALDDQRHVKVLWDEVPTHAETAAAVADLPPEFAEAEAMDELLIQQDAPPWADRAPDDDFRDDFRDPVGDPFRDPLGDPLRSDASRDDLRRDDPRRDDPRRDDPVVVPEEREPVVMHQSPGGPVVLEGVLVEQQPGGLPRRATPAPRPPAEERFDEAAADRFDAPAEHGTTAPPVEDPVDQPSAQRSDPPPAQRSGPGAADPLDPLDLPLDDPSPAGAARATVTDEELDQAIFGFEAASAADPTAPISGVGLTLLVTDLPRSLNFYRDMLGFNEVDQGAHNAVLASGTTRIVLREVTGAAPISRRLVHVNLEVNDIEAAYERLRESGVRFTYAPRVVNRGTKLEGWAAAFRDPDGHGVALTQWRERAEA